jgi:hypothetical protein
MSWTEEEFSAFNRERGQTAFKIAQVAMQQKTPKRHKYHAEPCIITADLTLFKKQDIHNAASLQRITLVRNTTPLKELAQACGIIGEWFASLKEAKRWIVLSELQKAGAIRELRRQVPYDLLVNGIKVCSWVADAVYEEFYDGTWLTVREDSKGRRTPEYQLKKKFVEAQFGWAIRET